MLTKVGKYLRNIRIECDELLLHMAHKLEISPAYLSHIETGKRKLPSELMDKISTIYNLTATQRRELFACIETVQISPRNPLEFDVAQGLARHKFDEDSLRKIKALLNKREIEDDRDSVSCRAAEQECA